MAVTDVLLDEGPEITGDLDVARSDLSQFGYCIVADALTRDEVETARERLVEQADAEEELGLSFRDGGPQQRLVDDFGNMRADAFSAANGGVNQRLWMLANKGECFRDRDPGRVVVAGGF